MIRVRVVAYLNLPEKLGWREKVVELEGEDPTYEDLLNALPELRAASREFEESGVKLVVLVNGEARTVYWRVEDRAQGRR